MGQAEAAQEALGTGCERQAENDVRVRDLFGPLLSRFSSIVGQTVGCLADADDGGLAQRTTAGLLYARPEGGRPVRIIVFTDGCGPAPVKSPAVPVIWCLTPDGQPPVVWGRVVEMGPAGGSRAGQ